MRHRVVKAYVTHRLRRTYARGDDIATIEVWHETTVVDATHDSETMNTEEKHVVRLMRVEEAAESLGIGRTKMYELMAQGRIPVVRIDGCTRLRPEDVERFAEQHLDDGRGIEPTWRAA